MTYSSLLLEYAVRSHSGHRVRLYKRCRVDVFAEYLLPDGLVCRLGQFSDIHSLSVSLLTYMYISHVISPSLTPVLSHYHHRLLRHRGQHR